MATKFDFKKSPDVNGTADKTTLYPKIVVAGTKNLENIADDIAKRSGFKAGTVIGLFSDLENLLTDYLLHSEKSSNLNADEICKIFQAAFDLNDQGRSELAKRAAELTQLSQYRG